MAGTTLVRTTMVGVRPLGVRGEPLHQAQAQIRGVIRRRLGDRHFHLLAEPQPHDLGGRIDWYSELEGEVRPLSSLPEAERQAALADIDALLADIDRLGQGLEAGPTDDGRLAGKSLRLAATRPSDDYLFLVGDQPVVVCWGYDTEAAGAVLPSAFLAAAATGTPAAATAAPAAAPEAPVAMPVAMAPAGAAVPAPAQFPWLFWLLAGLLAIGLVVFASYGLRQVLPVPPGLHVTELPPEPPPPAPPPPPDPTISLQGDIDRARDEEGKLRATLASLREEFGKRYLLCRPPEPPPKPPETKPEPKVAERKPEPPPPKPKPEPKVADRKPEPPPKPPDLPEDRWRKGDLGMLKGCWRLGRDANTNLRLPNGRIVSGHDRAGRICFGDNGHGTREKSSEFPGVPPIRCRAPIIAVFRGDTLTTTQPQVDCEPRGYFWTDRPNYLTCRRVSDTIALCRDNLGGEHEFRREG